jgi:transposase
MIDLIEIYNHWYAGRSKVELARSLGVDPKTVRKYIGVAEAAGLAPGGAAVSEEQWRVRIREWFPDRYDTRIHQPSWPKIAAHHQVIEKLLGVVPASVMHQRLRDEAGLEASVASFRRYLRAHFPEQVRSGEVTLWRPPVDPGAEAQVDYGYLGTWQDPWSGRRRRVWAFSMVLSYSRELFIYPVLVMDQRAWVEAHVAAFEFYGGCPARVALDNLRAGVIRPDIYDPKLNRAYAEMAAHYQVLLDPCRVGHPKDKPRIEAVQAYIRSSFFAGRDWPSWTAITQGAKRWCVEVAGKRTPRILEGRTPHEVFQAEEADALLRLPVVPFELATWSHPAVAPDAHAKVGRTLYSVPYRFIGVRLDARATAEVVQLFYRGELVKTHPFQARGRRTDWADLPEQRAAFWRHTPVWCRAQAAIIGPATDTLVGELLSVNALYRLRQAQGVVRLGERLGEERLEAACRRALSFGDPSYRTVKGILDAGVENDALQPPLPGIEVPAWLRGPDAFGGSGQNEGEQ